jgi:branched-chain amino acid transport system ATP-binding protein
VTALRFDDVVASYGEYKALQGLSFTLGASETLAVLGRNGVGKSTLARVATSLVPISSGQLDVLGHPIRKLRTHDVARLGVVHLPEGVGLFSALSIEENLVMRIGGASASDRRSRLSHALDLLGPLQLRRRAKAGQLSGGQQRLVAVSAAIAAQPKLLVADEPAMGLSPAAASDVYEALAHVKETGAALVIIETRLGHVEKLCTRALVMSDGRAVFDGDITLARHELSQLL